MNLQNDVLLLAGATGRIGTAVARRVLADGGRVAAAVRRPGQVARMIEALGRERVLVGVVGADDAEAAAGLVKGAQDALGAITAFVGAAGAWQARTAGNEPGGDLTRIIFNREKRDAKFPAGSFDQTKPLDILAVKAAVGDAP